MLAMKSPFLPSRARSAWLHSCRGPLQMQVRNIDKFMLYREKVGSFPTQPPSWWKPTDKLYIATEAAFEHAWRPYEKQYGPIFDTAAMTLHAVNGGVFMDRETQYMKSTRKP